MPSTATDRLAGATASVAVKAPCRVATTAPIILTGEQTVDGVAVVANDRVLVKDQADPIQNGIYVAGTSAWSRARDFDGARDAVRGTMILVNEGAAGAGFTFKVTTANPVVVGTSALVFSVNLFTDMTLTAFAQDLLAAEDAEEGRAVIGFGPFGSAGTLPVSDGDGHVYTAVSDLLDAALGNEQGSILYRGAAAWDVLLPGADGEVLTAHGIDEDPTWQEPAEAPAAGVAVGTIVWFACIEAPTGYHIANGQNIVRATDTDLTAHLIASKGTVTFNAGSDLVNLTAHSFKAGDRVSFSTNGTLPGVSAATVYFVIAAGLTANTFSVSTTQGGSAVNITGTDAGTHTIYSNPAGIGDGSTTVSLPNLQRVFPLGAGGSATSTIGNAVGNTGGAETHTLTTSEMPSHSHSVHSLSDSTGGGQTAQSGALGGVTDLTITGSVGSGAAHNNMPPSYVLLPCIKR